MRRNEMGVDNSSYGSIINDIVFPKTWIANHLEQTRYMIRHTDSGGAWYLSGKTGSFFPMET
jgi:hypothetical protein